MHGTICRIMLIHRTNAITYDSAHFGEGVGPIWMDDLNCRGDEQYLDNCRFPGWNKENCRHGEDAGVSCQCKLNLNHKIIEQEMNKLQYIPMLISDLGTPCSFY